MPPTSRAHSTDRAIACAACQTHSRPLYVPWHQHAVGCPVRRLELQGRGLELHQASRLASSIARF